MTILREGNNVIRKTDSGSEKITWKEFIDHYNREKIKRVQYFPYAYTSNGSRAFIEIINATIEIEGYNNLEISNQTSQISLAASEITSITEEWSHNDAEVLIWTKAKGHLSIKIR